MQLLWKAVPQKVRVPDGPSIALPCVHPRQLKNICQKMCTWMFTAALFIISKKQNQPKYSSIDERINKIWYIHWVDYFIIKIEVPIQASTWINPEKWL